MPQLVSGDLAAEIEALIALASRVLNEYTNVHDLCVVRGSAWPCERCFWQSTTLWRCRCPSSGGTGNAGPAKPVAGPALHQGRGHVLTGHLNWRILHELRGINADIGQFVAGILSDDLSREDQLTFALRLVVLAEHLRTRPTNPGMIMEGGVVDEPRQPPTPD